MCLNKDNISPDDMQRFESLLESLDDGPLKAALGGIHYVLEHDLTLHMMGSPSSGVMGLVTLPEEEGDEEPTAMGVVTPGIYPPGTKFTN